MALFDSILPPGQAPAAPASPTPVGLPPSLLAMLKGTPIAQNLGSSFSGVVPPTVAPTPGLGASAPVAPSPVPGPGPVIPKNIPPSSGPLPLPDPATAGWQAGAEGAAHAPVFNSPVATLASSVLEGIRKGVPAFRAQRQANKETQYIADLQTAQEKAYRDQTNSPDFLAKLTSVYGADRAATIQASLKAASRENGEKLLTDANLLKPSIVSFGTDGIMDTLTGKVLRKPTEKDVVYHEGDAVQAKDPNTGAPLTNSDGTPKMVYPAGQKPAETAYSKTDPDFKAHAVGYFPEANDLNWKPTPAQATLVNNAIAAEKARVAGASRTPLSELIQTEAARAELTSITKDYDSTIGQVKTVPALLRAKALLDTDQVNTGLTSGIGQQWSRLTGDAKAAATQEYLSNVLTTLIPEVRGQLAGGGGIRFTQQEIALFQKAAGGDTSMQKSALQNILKARLEDIEAARTNNNNKVGGFARQYPSAGPGVVSQYAIPAPDDPSRHKAPQNGVAYPDRSSPTGFLMTTDGGTTWKPAPAPGGSP